MLNDKLIGGTQCWFQHHQTKYSDTCDHGPYFYIKSWVSVVKLSKAHVNVVKYINRSPSFFIKITQVWVYTVY